jgi:hypothetical protein
MTRDNQRAWSGIQLFGPLDHVYGTSGSRQQRSGEKAGSRAANNGNLATDPLPASFSIISAQCNLPPLHGFPCNERDDVEAPA